MEIGIKELIICGERICTPVFRSLTEKMSLAIKGYLLEGKAEKLICTLHLYDEEGLECNFHVIPIKITVRNYFTITYTFDPISLSVYEAAESFMVSIKGERVSDISILEFRLTECGGENSKNIDTTSLCRAYTDEKGRRVVPVWDNRGTCEVFSTTPQNVLVVGNSLLLGIEGLYGMCASSPEKDYAYYLKKEILQYNPNAIFHKLKGAGVELAENRKDILYWWETDSNLCTEKPAKDSFDRTVDLVILQIGDNVNTQKRTEAFGDNADLLLELIKEKAPYARIVWVDSWYNGENTHDAIRVLCEKWKIEEVDIRDLYLKENQGYSGQKYINSSGEWGIVKDTWITHPGDEGMKKIADRILAVLQL